MLDYYLLNVLVILNVEYFCCNSESQFDAVFHLLSPETAGIDFELVSNEFPNAGLRNQMLMTNFGHNIGGRRNLSTDEHDIFVLVLIVPDSVQDFVEKLQQIGMLLAVDRNSVSEEWDPMYFIHWPHQALNVTFTKHLEDLISTKIRLDSDVFIIYPSPNSPGSFELYEIYTSFDNKLQIQLVQGPEQRQVYENYLLKSRRRQNLNGARLKAVGLADPDFTYQVALEVVNGTVRFLSGIGVEFLHTLQYMLNFSYVAVKGEGWIEQLENGSWLGMAKQIRSGEADLAISQSTQITYRFKGLGFLHPTAAGQVKVFFRQPPASSIRDIFISPFNVDLWFLLFGIWLLLVSSVFATSWIQLRYGLLGDFDAQITRECVFWSFSFFCQKSWYACPSTSSLRIIFLCGLFVGVIYYVAYSASLVSTLSIELVPITTIPELSKSELFILGDFWLPNNHDAVKSIELNRESGLKDEEQYIMIDEAIPKLLTNPMAYITFADGFLTVVHRFNYSDQFYCDTFSSINVMKAPVSSGMVVQKGSPLKELMNPKIQMMSERGITNRFTQHYTLGTSAQCPQKQSKLGKGLAIHEVFTVFFILAGGFSFSLCGLVLEYLVYHFWPGLDIKI